MSTAAARGREPTADSEAEQNEGREFEPRTLLRRSVPAFIAIAVLILVAAFAPGLGEVRDALSGADPGWVAVAVAFEGLSFASYIVMFAPVFCRGLSWRRSWQIGGSELAVGSIIPASGAGGLAFGAWVLHEGGMDADRIARRSVAFFLIKSSVNFFAVAIIGLLMYAGLFGVDEPWTLTLLPALMSIAIGQSVWFLRPDWLVRCVVAIGPSYALAWLLAAAVVVGGVQALEWVGWLASLTFGLHWSIRLLALFVFPAVTSSVSIYLGYVLFRTIGLLYRHHGQRFPWRF